MRVAAYARVSTQRQAQAQTTEQQLERLRAHAATRGWALPSECIFRDDGCSGAALRRPGLDRLRDAAAGARLDRILITAPDRLARNYVHQVLLVEELQGHGAAVEFLDRPMSQDPHDQLLLQIRGAVAEYERTLITERMRRGRLRKLQAGILLPWTRPPYGCRVDPERPRDPAGVRLDEAEAAVARDLFARFDKGASVRELARRLRGLGIVSPSGLSSWHLSTVRGLLKPWCTDPLGGARSRPGVGGCPCPERGVPALPFKLNQNRRHHIPRQTHKVTNWPAYDASLRRRGSLTVWFSAEAIEGWAAAPRTTPGGQPWYSALAILTALTLRAVFRLAYHQAEGLLGSIVGLLGLALRVPDHTTLSRRAATLEVPRPPRSGGTDGGGEAEPVHLLVDSTGLKLGGPGEWLVEKHGTRTRRSWRKLHLGVDADTGQIVASALTGRDAGDGAQVGPLLDQVDGAVASLTGDGAYDQEGVYASVAERHPAAAVIVPPRATAVPSDTAATAPTQRDRHLRHIVEHGRTAWQKASGYTKRARAEAAMARWKRVIGDGLRAHADARRATEVDVAVHALNRMLELGRPSYVRTT